MERRRGCLERSYAPGVSYILVIALVLWVPLSAACSGAEPVMGPEEPTEGEDQPTLVPQPTKLRPTPTMTSSTSTPVPSPVVEERIAEVEWPGSMRVSDGEVVRLALLVSPEEAYLTPEVSGHEVESTKVPLPVTRAGYNGYVNASLAAAGMHVAAAGPTRQGLQPGRANTWRWTISAPQAGTYHLIISLSVLWEPQPGTDAREPFEEAVWSRVLTVQARAPLGLSGPQADWLGLGGTVLGTVAGLPFIERVLSILWKRLRDRRDEDEDMTGD